MIPYQPLDYKFGECFWCLKKIVMIESKKPNSLKYPASLWQYIWWKVTRRAPYGPYYLAGLSFRDF